ncbi:MAG TPA: chemotaxis protein CheX [Acidimicrobiales bacterium]|nr:chemotaxis protein CheX [Acidimicrobiales bacterium]
MTDLVSNETIAEITQTFWGAYLPDAGDLIPAVGLPAIEDVRSRVDIDGAWTGCVEVSCSMAVARKIASVMFAAEPSEIAEADVRDAVGELVNVVGGNIKSILPAPTSLSVPILDDGGEWRFAAELESEVLLAWAGEPIVVRVWRPEGTI